MSTTTIERPAIGVEQASNRGCLHCGELLGDDRVDNDAGAFCCGGCSTVHALLVQSGLGGFYELAGPVAPRAGGHARDFAYLDDEETLAELCSYVDGERLRVEWVLPAIHCASCLWLLERLPQLESAVVRARVDLLGRRLTVVLDRGRGTLADLAALLSRLGYPPELQFDQLGGSSAARQRSRSVASDRLGLRIGVAGFAAGNVMLLAFPEYLGMSAAELATWRPLFGALSLVLAIPVVWFSGGDYLRQAATAIRLRRLNVDLPIALGMLAMLGHSAFEIIGGSGPGYLDSLLGLVFFLLLGRWFQRQTHRRIVFDRDYRSYLPLSARVRTGCGVSAERLDRLRVGDVVEVVDGEVLPADGILVDGEARLDRSFITGEDVAVRVPPGGEVQAGCRQRGGAIAVRLTGSVASSYLARLWSESAFRQNEDRDTSGTLAAVGRYFSLATLTLGALTLAYWWPTDAGTAVRSATAVLIVACPCAASLALPFVYGRLAGIAGRHGLALRSAAVVERFAEIDASAFDKTGTLTGPDAVEVVEVVPPDSRVAAHLSALAATSVHPVSRALVNHLAEAGSESVSCAVEERSETPGSGLSAQIGGHRYRLGRPAWVGACASLDSTVAVSCDGEPVAAYRLRSRRRAGVSQLIRFARRWGPVSMISGDGDADAQRWRELFGEDRLSFRQNPTSKLRQMEAARTAGHRVLYVGDGLNDAGALRAAHVGLAVSSESGGFNPACDGVLDAGAVERLAGLWRMLAGGRALVYGALGLAVAYNLVGVAFAVSGRLEPVVAAILMPLSSLTVVAYAWIASWAWSRTVLRGGG